MALLGPPLTWHGPPGAEEEDHEAEGEGGDAFDVVGIVDTCCFGMHGRVANLHGVRLIASGAAFSVVQPHVRERLLWQRRGPWPDGFKQDAVARLRVRRGEDGSLRVLHLVAAPCEDEELEAVHRARASAAPPEREHPSLGRFTYLAWLNWWEAECLAPGSTDKVSVKLSCSPDPRDPANEAALEAYWEEATSAAAEVLRELPVWSSRLQERAADELLDAYNRNWRQENSEEGTPVLDRAGFMSAIGPVTTIDVKGPADGGRGGGTGSADGARRRQLMLWTSQEMGSLFTDHTVWASATIMDGITEVSV